MSDKQVYELTRGDLERCGAWFFPMDDSVEDELTVRQLEEFEPCSDLQMIVRTRFEGSNGARYVGYLYWDGSGDVGLLKPVLFLEDGSAVSFWSGLIEPSWEEYPEEVQSLRQAFPITFISESILGLAEISGVLEGLYYLDGDTVSLI